MSALQNAMAALIGVFHQHAGDDQLLNKAELKGLLDKEFKGMLGNAKDPKITDEIFKGLDQDGSGTVDFTEFVTMVACLTAVTNEMICKKQ
ncbi:ictacalcin-like [Engraulis encrasicolus]|uniref:ictacalcin-like n=1 Tax=Engraulis encrasicolus TaxID=184585 RepID=UPI002FD4D345